jgi:hypothetical protein
MKSVTRRDSDSATRPVSHKPLNRRTKRRETYGIRKEMKRKKMTSGCTSLRMLHDLASRACIDEPLEESSVNV